MNINGTAARFWGMVLCFIIAAIGFKCANGLPGINFIAILFTIVGGINLLIITFSGINWKNWNL